MTEACLINNAYIIGKMDIKEVCNIVTFAEELFITGFYEQPLRER